MSAELDVSKLRSTMKAQGVSQSELVKRSHVTRAQLSRLLSRDRSIVRTQTLSRLAGSLGMDPAELIVDGRHQQYLNWVVDGNEFVDFRGIGMLQIVGIFGRPLGSLVTICGKWVGPGLRKDGNLRFQVTDVNGRAPEGKIELLHGVTIKQVFPDRKGRGPKPGEAWNWKYDFYGSVPSPTPTEGETWEMLGVEMGDFYYCFSEEARSEIGWTIFDQGPSFDRPFCFYTCFEYIAVRIVKSSCRSAELDQLGTNAESVPRKQPPQ